MLVVPGDLVMGSAVLLIVAPHADLHFFFLVPAISHLVTTPCVHALGTWSYHEGRERCRNRLPASKFTSFLPHFSHTRLLIIYRCCNEMFVGFALCTYQTYADCPIQTQTPCYPCCPCRPCRHPNCSCCHWAFPRQMSRCPQSQAEQH